MRSKTRLLFLSVQIDELIGPTAFEGFSNMNHVRKWGQVKKFRRESVVGRHLVDLQKSLLDALFAICDYSQDDCFITFHRVFQAAVTTRQCWNVRHLFLCATFVASAFASKHVLQRLEHCADSCVIMWLLADCLFKHRSHV